MKAGENVKPLNWHELSFYLSTGHTNSSHLSYRLGSQVTLTIGKHDYCSTIENMNTVEQYELSP